MERSSFAVHLVATAVSPSADSDRLRFTDVTLNPGNTSGVHLLGNLVDSWLHKRGHKWKVSNEITQTRSITSDLCSGSNKRGLRGCLGGCFDGFWPRLQLNVLGQRVPAKKANTFFNCRTWNVNLSQLGKGPQRWNKYGCIMRMQRLWGLYFLLGCIVLMPVNSLLSRLSSDLKLERMYFNTWHRFLPLHGETVKMPTQWQNKTPEISPFLF